MVGLSSTHRFQPAFRRRASEEAEQARAQEGKVDGSGTAAGPLPNDACPRRLPMRGLAQPEASAAGLADRDFPARAIGRRCLSRGVAREERSRLRVQHHGPGLPTVRTPVGGRASELTSSSVPDKTVVPPV